MRKIRKSRLLLSASIVAAGLLAYGSTLKTGFLWDDHEIIERNPFIKTVSIKNIVHAFSGDVFDQKGDAYYRPLQTLSDMLDYRIWGPHPFGFHLTNIAFHLLTAVLLFLLFSDVFKNQWTGYWAGLFFAIHPIGVEQLLIVAGRAEVMSFTFAVLTVFFGRRKDDSSRIASFLFYVLACLSKESGIVAPLFLLIVDRAKGNKSLSFSRYGPYILIAAAYLFLRKSALPASDILPRFSSSLGFVVHDLPPLLIRYLRIIILPYDLHSHRRMDFSGAFVVAGWLFIFLFLIFSYRKKNPFLLFSAAWFFAGLLPKFPILAVNSLMLDHWAYPSAAGVLLFIGAQLARSKKPFGLIAGAILAMGWGGATMFFIQHRGTDRKMYEWAVRYPSSSIVRYNLGVLEYQKGNYEKADELFRRSYAMNQDQKMWINGMAFNLAKLGRRDEAMDWLSRWTEKYPNYFLSYYTRAKLTEGQSSLNDLNKALSLNPDFQDGLLMKGVRLLQLKRYREAKDAFLQLVSLNPLHVEGNLNLGTAYAYLGRRDAAVRYWQRTLELDPDNKLARANLKGEH